MDPKHGYGFIYATSLCSLHFFVSSFVVRAPEWLGLVTPARLPLRGALPAPHQHPSCSHYTMRSSACSGTQVFSLPQTMHMHPPLVLAVLLNTALLLGNSFCLAQGPRRCQRDTTDLYASRNESGPCKELKSMCQPVHVQMLFKLSFIHSLCAADSILFSAIAGTSVATLNLSLLVNSVGFYQVNADPSFSVSVSASAVLGLHHGCNRYLQLPRPASISGLRVCSPSTISSTQCHQGMRQ